MKKRKLVWIALMAVLSVPFWGTGSTSEAKSIPINEKTFLDFYFRHYVKKHYDTNQDGKLSEKERNAVTEIDVGDTSEYRLDLGYPSPGALDGIEYFPKLRKLNCTQCGLRVLDVSGNKELEELNCSDNYLGELDVKKNKKLKVLFCSDNKLKKLDVSANKNVMRLHCSDNKLRKINLNKNKKIYDLLVSNNMLKKLDLKKLTNLEEIYCGENQLKKLDVTHNKKLISLECDRNKLTSLNVTKTKSLTICTVVTTGFANWI